MRAFSGEILPRLRARQAAFVLACLLVAMPVVTGAVATRTNADARTPLAARVDREVISQRSLRLLANYARLEDPSVSLDAMLDQMIDGRLLARHAIANYPQDLLFPEQRVAFALDVGVDDRLIALLRVSFRDEWEAPLRTALDRAILPSPRVTANDLAAVVGMPARLRLEPALTAEEHRLASRLVVLHYRLPGGRPVALTLDDLYRRQNVQGAINLHNLDVEFLQTQARQRLAELLALDWAERRLGRSVVTELRRSLRDREFSRALRERYGIGTDMHRGSPVIADLQAAVSAADVRAWYDAHRGDFRYVARVRLRHIRVADEDLADGIAAQLRKEPHRFAELARRYSIAVDRYAGGDLGWLARRTEADWFTELAFAQTLHQPGAPVREPVAAGVPANWELVLIEDQETADFAPDDETVRYQASRAIAAQRARDAYATLDARLHKAAMVQKYDLALSSNKAEP